MTQLTIALNKTVLSDLNMRQGDVDVSDLIASMKARVAKGLPVLIQNLGATMQLDADGKETGVAEIHVGGRRWRALNELAKAKIIKRTHPITVNVTASREDAMVETSEENDVRLPPNPVDQYENFARMIEAGHSPADIAARFNIDEARVHRRLKLAKVSPKLLALYREGTIEFEQLAAFTLADDHAVQEAAYFDVPEGWARNAGHIRKRLTEGEVDASTDRLARFVGMDAYRAAGGAVRLDLFSLKGEGFIQDVALLQRLAAEKLSAEAAVLEGEGWKWVRVEPEINWQEMDAMGRIYEVDLPLSEEVTAQIEKLSEQYQALEAEGQGETVEGAAAMDAIEAQLYELEASGRQWRDEEKALAGAIVYIDTDAHAKIRRGMVAPEDRKAMTALTRAREAGEAVAAADDGDTTKIATVQAEASGAGISATLRENLSVQHSMALRAALLDNPTVALVTTVHRMLLIGHYRNNTNARQHGAAPFEGLGWNDNLDKHVNDIRETVAGQKVATAQEAMTAALPADPAQLWDYLVVLPEARLLEVLAYAVQHMVYAVSGYGNARVASAYQMAEALSLDMADYWTATVPSYFGRVGKGEIASAVREAKGDEAAAGLASLKKGEMAEQAATLLADTRWLPAALRTRGVNDVQGGQADDADQLAEAREPSDIPEAA